MRAIIMPLKIQHNSRHDKNIVIICIKNKVIDALTFTVNQIMETGIFLIYNNNNTLFQTIVHMNIRKRSKIQR